MTAVLIGNVSRETQVQIERYVTMLLAANEHQNLVSRDSLIDVWTRHIVDSAQLFSLICGETVDIGSGAGFPGMILALMGGSLTLVEPRQKRFDFLVETAAALGLRELRVLRKPAKRVMGAFDTITARAVATIDGVLHLTHHLARPSTRWVLPKGRSVQSELEVARAAWHARFELVPSITDPSGMVVVIEDVKPKAGR